jgi:uncharacterized paraquat-inducible protein A
MIYTMQLAEQLAKFNDSISTALIIVGVFFAPIVFFLLVCLVARILLMIFDYLEGDSIEHLI